MAGRLLLMFYLSFKLALSYQRSRAGRLHSNPDGGAFETSQPQLIASCQELQRIQHPMQIQTMWPVSLKFEIHPSKASQQHNKIVSIQICEEATIFECLQQIYQWNKLSQKPQNCRAVVNGQQVSLQKEVSDLLNYEGSFQDLLVHIYYEQRKEPKKKSSNDIQRVSVKLKDPLCEMMIRIEASATSTFNDVLVELGQHIQTEPFRSWSNNQRFALTCNGASIAECRNLPLTCFMIDGKVPPFMIQRLIE